MLYDGTKTKEYEIRLKYRKRQEWAGRRRGPQNKMKIKKNKQNRNNY